MTAAVQTLPESRFHTVRAPKILLGFLFITALSGRFTVPEGLPLGGVDARILLAVPLVVWLFLWYAANAAAMKHTPANPSTRWMLLLLGYHLCSTIWSVDGARIGSSVAGGAILIALVWGASVIARLDPIGARVVFLWCTYAAGITYCAASLLTGATGGAGQSVAFGGGPNVFARIMILAVIAAAGLYFRTGRRTLLFVTPLLLTSAMLSASRGALSSAVATGALALLILGRRLRVIHVIVGLAIAPLLGWIIWTNDRVQLLAERRFDWQTLVASGYSGRGTLWSAARDLFWEYPLVGTGIDSFHARAYATTGFSYPHNLILEIGVDLGLLGLALLLTTWLIAIREVAKARHLWDATSFAVAMSAFFVFAASMFSGDIYDSRFAWILLALALPTRLANKPTAATDLRDGVR